MTNQEFPQVSVLFVTYKRFELLKATVESFIRNTDYPNLQLVIADDGSGPEIQSQIRALPANDFSLPAKNRGLGANNNSGLKLCTGKYILMIQDDWACHGPSDYLRQTVSVMEANPTVGIINFASVLHPPDLSRRLPGSTEPCYVTPKPYEDGRKEYFLYADQPHIRSRAALDYVGPYIEDRDMEKCEIDYNHRWKDQTKFLTAVFPGYHLKVFSNEGVANQMSFRTGRFRYKVAAALQPLKPFLQKYANPLFVAGKASVQGTLKLLEKMRIVR
ncbi:glycosyltransferase family 2 protein [Silvibacterium acidisoli]|uniref:glycosyltransferase family 2 protein n=1 Tax=Acidobacteriaceae bacterium ZG23-2 TaxID=2883246 RepID=UPI00406C2C2F